MLVRLQVFVDTSERVVVACLDQVGIAAAAAKASTAEQRALVLRVVVAVARVDE